MDPAAASGPTPRPTSAPTTTLQPPPAVVAGRLKGLFAPAYLTLISIIQGVALATLAAQVEAGYARFDAIAWVIVAVTMVTFVAVWTEYVQAIATYVWLPNLTDALVPFAIATLELFLAHFAVRGAAGLRGYLLILGLTFFAGAGGYVQLALRAGAPRAQADNRDVHRALDRTRAARIGQAVASGLLGLVMWAAYDAAGLERYGLIAALTIGIVNVAFLLGSVPYWNRVLTYALTA